MSTNYFNERLDPEEFDATKYIPNPDDLRPCEMCGHAYDVSILGEVVEHMHDPDLPIHPILYMVRGKRKDDNMNMRLLPPDKKTIHDMLMQFMMRLALKYEFANKQTLTVNIRLDNSELVSLTVVPVEDKDFLILFADQKEAGVFTFEEGGWVYAGPLSEREQAQLKPHVVMLHSQI